MRDSLDDITDETDGYGWLFTSDDDCADASRNDTPSRSNQMTANTAATANTAISAIQHRQLDSSCYSGYADIG